jgi:periplasmic copper chaperone A
MRRLLLSTITTVSLTLAAAVTSVSTANASDLMVTKAFARASATPTAQTGAAYVSLMNHANEADRLVSVSSPVAAMSHIHKSEVVDGVMKMQSVEALEIPVHGMLEMKPGGYHIMFMGLKQPLKQGEEIDLTLRFENAGDVTIKVPVGGVATSGE